MNSSKNTFGHIYKLTSFGESHGVAMGGILDGLPSGITIDNEEIQAYLQRRRPGYLQGTTQRREPDQVEVLSGIFQNKTLGTPVGFMVRNTSQRSEDYKGLKPRSGHADRTWSNKYNHVDLRGGGRSSGRETLSRVFSGAVAKQASCSNRVGLEVKSFILNIGSLSFSKSENSDPISFDSYDESKNPYGLADAKQTEQVVEFLKNAQKEGQSYGARIGVLIKSTPQGLGQPVFSKFKSDLASGIMSLGAVSAFQLGGIENSYKQPGTEFHSNAGNYGGINGGITSGKDIYFEVLIKPTSSILDVAKRGRHDPCIAIRAAVVLESITWHVLFDHILYSRLDNLYS